MIQVTIDNQTVEVPLGTTVLQACRQAGIEIPTLCDHPSLKPYGGCRLCVVEVEGLRTLQPACSLPAYDQMVVHTQSERIHKARQFILQMIFSERNHYCMYCQKSGGDCDLQNAAYAENLTHWPLQPNWDAYCVDASHPYFIIDHNRCILCRRCVRACDELVGNHTLDIENRGARSMVIADRGLPVGESSCVNCGTCVQVCPTGAFIDRHSAYLGLNAQVERVSSICIGCSMGCGIELVVRNNRLVRIDGDFNAPVNRGVLCETGRYLPLADERQRIQTPLVRKDGTLQPATWQQAISILTEQLSRALQAKRGIAAYASPRLPAEALHAFERLFSGEILEPRFADLNTPGTSQHGESSSQADDADLWQSADCFLVIDADLSNSHPVASFFIQRRLPKDARLVAVEASKTRLSDIAQYALQHAPGEAAGFLQKLSAAIATQDPSSGSSSQNGHRNSLGSAARLLASSQHVVILVSDQTLESEPGIWTNVVDLAHQIDATLLRLGSKANSEAALRYKLDAHPKPEAEFAYVALGDDTPAPELVQSLAGARFLVVQASYHSPLTQQARVVLPVQIWTEQEGHYLNFEGRLQKTQAALSAPPEVRSNLQVLQMLASQLERDSDDRWRESLLKNDTQGALAS
ncbi:MAG: molybdopterin-dependent oxidoreductase [Anaerolineales bacterium]